MDDAILPMKRGRAWVEINLDALASNIADIRSNIPESCEIMAIVKANAYGHGVENISKRLIKEGIKIFAVATLVEGIELRQYIPDADILVLGYTQAQDSRFLKENNLTQLVVDDSHAKLLDSAGYKLNVHVAIDSGMHRLGIEPSNYEAIESIFKCENLTITGIATHLSSSDSLDNNDIDFTNSQLEKFFSVVEKLKKNDFNTGKLHAQSSYGIYNYPDIKCDYVRPGIMMYGVQSQNDVTKIKTGLCPVLSLKAVIAQVRWIEAGEGISYGRTFITEKRMKLATVSIGYADGFPRQISSNGGEGIVHGHKVPIVGRVCMDMIMLDVTDIEHVNPGDIATLIGKNGSEEIRCEDVAEGANTISNDILAGLGGRLPRIYIGG